MKNKHYIILAISIITFIFALIYYDSNRVVSLAKAEVIGSQWKCVGYVDQLIPVGKTLINNRRYLSSASGDGYEEKCNILEDKNARYYVEYFIILKIFDVKTYTFEVDSKQQAIDMVNKKNLIVKLNKNIEIVSIE